MFKIQRINALQDNIPPPPPPPPPPRLHQNLAHEFINEQGSCAT